MDLLIAVEPTTEMFLHHENMLFDCTSTFDPSSDIAFALFPRRAILGLNTNGSTVQRIAMLVEAMGMSIAVAPTAMRSVAALDRTDLHLAFDRPGPYASRPIPSSVMRRTPSALISRSITFDYRTLHHSLSSSTSIL
jgi:hypothetical protein